VHRDIKPSNVLVDATDGSVKLLDFGIAKLLQAEPGTDFRTRAATGWMTPEYASPEQVLARPVTTATDVHGLGVLLFELLTGHRPFGSGGESGFELGRLISEEVPRLASSAVVVGRDVPDEAVAAVRGTTPDRLRRALSGDLDAIVAKALRKEPGDRYPAVQAMLDDVERHRTGFPVQAREGMWAYRARKFVRRHWLSVAAAMVVTTTLGGASLVLGLQRAETERERDRASAAAAQATLESENARLVIDFLADVFRGRDPNQGPSDTVTARELLAWGTERVATEFADRPEIQSELYAVMGGAHYNLGLLDEGVALFERALETTRQVHGARSAPVADVLLKLGRTHGINRDFELALPFFEEALELRRELYAPDDSLIAEVMVGLGTLLRDAGQPDSAEVVLLEAVRVAKAGGGEGSIAVRAGLGLAYVLRGQGRLEEAQAIYEEALPRALARPDMRDLELATHLNNLAYLRRLREDYAGADTLYRRALEITTETHGRGHPSSLLFAQNLAGTLSFMGRDDEVVRVLTESAEAAATQWPDGHWRVGQAQIAVGRALMRTGDPASSKGPLRAGVQSYTDQLGADHQWTRYANVTYRVAQILADDDPEARSAIDSFYADLKNIREVQGGVLQPGAVGQLQQLVFVLDWTGLNSDAERFRALLPEAEAGR
jgi:tetratricopeptide (TPR) repeat protein